MFDAARGLPDAVAMATHAESAALLLKALAHPARLLVMCRLAEREASVGELQQVGMSMSALWQHLGVLRNLGLVRTRGGSQTIVYSLSNGPVLAVMQTRYEPIARRR